MALAFPVLQFLSEVQQERIFSASSSRRREGPVIQRAKKQYGGVWRSSGCMTTFSLGTRLVAVLSSKQ